MTPSLQAQSPDGPILADLDVRPFFTGYRLTYSDGSPVTDINGQHLTFANKEAANELRKATGRQIDALMRRLSTADITKIMESRS